MNREIDELEGAINDLLKNIKELECVFHSRESRIVSLEKTVSNLKNKKQKEDKKNEKLEKSKINKQQYARHIDPDLNGLDEVWLYPEKYEELVSELGENFLLACIELISGQQSKSREIYQHPVKPITTWATTTVEKSGMKKQPKQRSIETQRFHYKIPDADMAELKKREGSPPVDESASREIKALVEGFKRGFSNG